MALWSDGRTRSDDYQGTDLYRALRRWCGDQLEERVLELRWENERLRLELEHNKLKTMAAKAGKE